MMLPACAYPTNTLNYTPIVRALLIDMVDWTLGRADPPESRWPSLAKGELQKVEDLHGPQVPAVGLAWPKVFNQPIPPAGKPAWPQYVPAIDADGNDVPGIRMPAVISNGTYLGWNLRKAGYGKGDLCLLSGTYLPFAKDAASRNGDTRPSLIERRVSPWNPTGHPAASEAALAAYTAMLVGQRLLLEEDARKLEAAPAGAK
jgi:hypothetical protein